MDLSSNFEYSVLTKISGQPTYAALRKIKRELSANATIVSCNLGGGAHGHLGLVLNNYKYAELSQTPYAQPIHPGTLELASGLAQYLRTEMRDDHKKTTIIHRIGLHEQSAVEAIEP